MSDAYPNNLNKAKRPATRYEKFDPSPGLKDIVYHYWILTSQGKCVATRSRWRLPISHIAIEFNFQDNAMTIRAPALKAAHVRFAGQVKILGIVLQTGAFYSLFRCPAHFITGDMPLKSVVGEKALPFEKVFSARNLKAAIGIAESLLKKLYEDRIPINPKIRKALAAIYESEGNIKIADIYRLVSMSSRHFERLFREWTGLSPKLFCSVCRFAKLYEYLHDNSEIDLLRTALHMGYYDQSHFADEFKKFRDLTPSQVQDIRRFVYGKKPPKP